MEEKKFKAYLKKENKIVDVMSVCKPNRKLFIYIDKEKNGLVVWCPFEDAEFMQCVEPKDETSNKQYIYEKVEYNVVDEFFKKRDKYTHSLLKIKKDIDLNKLKEFGYSEYNDGKGYIKEFEDYIGFTFAEVRINKRSRRILGTYYENPAFIRGESFELRILIDFDFTHHYKINLVQDLIDAGLVEFVEEKK